MAEAVAVVGLVGSIASLIDLGVKITARLHDFTTRTLEVPELFRSLEKRLPLLTSTLLLIQQQEDAERLSVEVSTALPSLIRSTSAQLKVVENCLLKIIPPSDASHLRRAIKALQSLTKDGDIRMAIEGFIKTSIFSSCIKLLSMLTRVTRYWQLLLDRSWDRPRHHHPHSIEVTALGMSL